MENLNPEQMLLRKYLNELANQTHSRLLAETNVEILTQQVKDLQKRVEELEQSTEDDTLVD